MMLARKITLGMVSLGLFVLVLGACRSSPFNGEDPTLTRRNQYFDGTMVQKERENRRNSTETGFGYPSGPGQQ